MESKKHKKYELEGRFPLHFSIGLVTALLLVTAAFEWRGEYSPVDFTVPRDRIDDPVIIYRTSIPPPEPPKPRSIHTPEPPKPEQVRDIIPVDDLTDILNTKDPIEFPDIPVDPLPVEPPPPEIFEVVESKPTFPGGEKAFYEYVRDHIEYPGQARSRNVEGQVYVQFVIHEDGSISDVKTIKGIGFGCDEEAEEVLRNSPKWNPGKQRGRPVKVRMVIPIKFKLGY